MHPLVKKLARALKNRDVPLVTLARKIVVNVVALGRGMFSLRACTSVGARARCLGRPHIDNRGEIVVLDDFGICSAFGAASLTTTAGGRIEIGREVIVNYGTSIGARRLVRIGDRVKIGPYCVIEDGDVPAALARPGDLAAPIEIGSDVWLAGRVVVRPGARIGSGAVIAAGSVVEGEVPPNAVASGIPARVLRVSERAQGEVPHAA
ncbi:MAG: acyltransferase [Byssovorax sp.]